jgi:hypothetical protein
MSVLLEVETPRPFRPEDLGLADLVVAEGDGALFLHRTGVSTRVTTVRPRPGGLDIEIRVLASDADVDLAVAIATAPGGPVTVEGTPVAPDEVAGWFGVERRAALLESAARALGHMIGQHKGPLTINGPVRPFVVGHRLLAELDGPDLPARLLEALRAVQWDVPARYRDAGVFVAGEDRTNTFAVWVGDEDLVLPNVKWLALSADEQSMPILVPAERAPELAGDHARALDEHQLLVDQFAPAEWAELMERARRFAVERI